MKQLFTKYCCFQSNFFFVTEHSGEMWVEAGCYICYTGIYFPKLQKNMFWDFFLMQNIYALFNFNNILLTNINLYVKYEIQKPLFELL